MKNCSKFINSMILKSINKRLNNSLSNYLKILIDANHTALKKKISKKLELLKNKHIYNSFLKYIKLNNRSYIN